MKLQFNLQYRTTFGEVLILNIVGADGTARHERHTMATLDGKAWTYTLSRQAKTSTYIDYYYSVEKSGRETRREWEATPHRLELIGTRSATYTTYDRWIDVPKETPAYSSAMTDCINRRDRRLSDTADFAKMVRLKVRTTRLRPGERLALAGADPYLGGWQRPFGGGMAEHSPNEWVASIDAARLASRRPEFQFVAVRDSDGVITQWEQGENRTIALPAILAGDVLVYELGDALFDTPLWRGAGTVAPLFALRSRGSFGVGDLGDLRMMTDWVASTGQHALQLLPVNDTTATHTWTDSYPYSAISVYAIHPMYTDLRQLPPLKDAARREHYEMLRRELNALPQADYERVNTAKTEYLRELYAQEWPAVGRRATFKRFFEANKEWLVPYAAFCHYRDLHGTPDHTRWPGHERLYDKERADMGNPLTKLYKTVSFWYFVQYNLDNQMRAAHEHARSRRVILKGDIAIGVGRHSVETWTQPRYFNMDGQAGAPPDAFAACGQNWGFPTYNWNEMLADGCRWWTERLGKMAEYFDAYRIDHVLGFFRIWEIPSHAVNGLLGQFVPALGMTVHEIAAYGLHTDRDRLTRPYITDAVLEELFGGLADRARSQCLDGQGGSYSLKPGYDTQRKVEAAFAGKDSEDDTALRDGLYRLVANVLFVPDRNDPSRLHPRIAAQTEPTYAALTDREKTVFNRLYDDYYYRRHNQYWYNEAMRKLPRMAQATRMLMCAEDLGMVPECVPWAMKKLHILSLEIQSMPKDSGRRFADLSGYPYLSVCTISTHDTPTMRQWWDEDAGRAQAYFADVLHHDGGAPHPLPAQTARDIVARHLSSRSMLCIITLQDWLATDERLRHPDAEAERINIPAEAHHYWRYRMHLNIEDLMAADDFNASIRDLIEAGER